MGQPEQEPFESDPLLDFLVRRQRGENVPPPEPLTQFIDTPEGLAIAFELIRGQVRRNPEAAALILPSEAGFPIGSPQELRDIAAFARLLESGQKISRKQEVGKLPKAEKAAAKGRSLVERKPVQSELRKIKAKRAARKKAEAQIKRGKKK